MSEILYYHIKGIDKRHKRYFEYYLKFDLCHLLLFQFLIILTGLSAIIQLPGNDLFTTSPNNINIVSYMYSR